MGHEMQGERRRKSFGGFEWMCELDRGMHSDKVRALFLLSLPQIWG